MPAQAGAQCLGTQHLLGGGCRTDLPGAHRTCSPLEGRAGCLSPPQPTEIILQRNFGRPPGSTWEHRSFPAPSIPAGVCLELLSTHTRHPSNWLQRILGLNYIFNKNKLALLVLTSCFNNCLFTSFYSNFELLEKPFAAYRFLMRQMARM